MKMVSSRSARRQPFSPVFVFVLSIAATAIVVVQSAEDKCSADSSLSFYCPNCDGIQVKDCMNCDGYLFTDYNHEICYDRRLFHTAGRESGDPDDHYPFLWNDM